VSGHAAAKKNVTIALKVSDIQLALQYHELLKEPQPILRVRLDSLSFKFFNMDTGRFDFSSTLGDILAVDFLSEPHPFCQTYYREGQSVFTMSQQVPKFYLDPAKSFRDELEYFGPQVKLYKQQGLNDKHFKSTDFASINCTITLIPISVVDILTLKAMPHSRTVD